MSDLYIEARLQAIMEIADSACSDSKDIENINGFCTEIEDFLNKQDVPDTNVGDLISRKKLIRDLFYSSDGNRYRTRDCDNFPITISFEDLRKVINNQPQVQPIVRSTEETKQKLMEYFNIGDSSAYYLTRVKEAFSIGTMTLDDFVEFTESDIDDLIDCLTKKEV